MAFEAEFLLLGQCWSTTPSSVLSRASTHEKGSPIRHPGRASTLAWLPTAQGVVSDCSPIPRAKILWRLSAPLHRISTKLVTFRSLLVLPGTTKAFDTVYRGGLRLIMAKFGCPRKCTALVRQLHDGMRATVHDNGDT